MVKILMYRDKFIPIIGGIETHIANIIQHLPNHDFEILTNAIPHEKSYEKYGPNSVIRRFSPVDYTVVPFKNPLLSKTSFSYRVVSDVVRLRNKKNYLRNTDYDILHIHSHDICSNLLRIDRKLGRFIFTNLIDFSYIKKPILFTFHGLYSNLQKNDIMARQFDEKFVKVFDNIVVVDKYIETALKQLCKKKGFQKNIWFIPNSVDTNKFKHIPHRKREKLKIGFVGRVEDELSGLKLLRRLVHLKPPWLEISIIGAGTNIAIDRFKSTIDLKKVEFLSNVEPKKIPFYLSDFDILFNPVLTGAITRVTLEAMACGRPVIMIGKNKREPIIDCETGFLIEYDIESLINLLRELHGNRDEIKDIGQAAREVVVRGYNMQTFASKIKEIYDALIKEVK